eukprot:scaffold15712_cov67-Phaeocystis_antarctica.AAC.7
MASFPGAPKTHRACRLLLCAQLIEAVSFSGDGLVRRLHDHVVLQALDRQQLQPSDLGLVGHVHLRPERRADHQPHPVALRAVRGDVIGQLQAVAVELAHADLVDVGRHAQACRGCRLVSTGEPAARLPTRQPAQHAERATSSAKFG